MGICSVWYRAVSLGLVVGPVRHPAGWETRASLRRAQAGEQGEGIGCPGREQ